MTIFQKLIIVVLNIFVIMFMIYEMLSTPIYSESDLTLAQQRAVELARKGDYKDALTKLRILADYAQTRQPLWEDYITVLHWDGQNKKALTFIDNVDLSKSPDYFLQTLQSIADAEKNADVLLDAIRFQHHLKIQQNDHTVDLSTWEYFNRFVSQKHYDHALVLLKHIRLLMPLETQDLLSLIQSYQAINNPHFADLVIALYEQDNTQKQVHSMWVKHQVQLARNGKEDQALSQLQTHIDQYPSDTQAIYEYLTIASWNNHHTALAYWSEHLIDDAPTYVLNAVAKLSRAKEDYDQSIKYYNHSLTQDAQQQDARLGLIYALADNDDVEKARYHVDTLEDPQKGFANAYITAAQKPIEEMLSAEALAKLAYTQRGEGNYQKALNNYQIGAQKHPTQVDFYLGQILALNALNKHQIALSMSHQALSKWPDNLPLMNAKVDALMGLGKHDHALREQESILSLSPRNHYFKRWADINRHFNSNQQIVNYQRLQFAHPESNWLVADSVAAHSKYDRCNEAVVLAEKMQIHTAPAYAIEALGQCYRKQHQTLEAIRTYAVGARRFPSNPNFPLGKALSYLDNNEPSKANDTLLDAQDQFPTHLGILHALALSYRRLNKMTYALSLYADIQKRYPNDLEAYRENAMTLMSLGSADYAFSLAQKKPDAFSPTHWKSLYSDRAALAIRRSVIYESNITVLKSRLNQAEKYTHENQHFLDQHFPHDEQAHFNAKLDYILLLNAMKEPVELTEQYQALSIYDYDIPVAIHYAAADAYLALKEPDAAIEALRHSSNTSPSAQQLYYAMLDTLRADEASRINQQLRLKNPIWRASDQSTFLLPNYQRSAVDLRQHLHLAYTNQLDKAESALTEFLAKGAANTEVRSHLATVYRWRGLPRKALTEFQLIQASEPNYTAANVGKLYTDIDLRRYDHIDTEIQALEHNTYRSHAVAQLKEDWSRHKLASLNVRAYAEEGNGSRFASRDNGIEISLSSALLKHQFRITGRVLRKQNRQQQNITQQRGGLGLTWEKRDWFVATEVTQDLEGSDAGINLLASWTASDHWRWQLQTQSYSDQTPLRAFNDDISLRTSSLSVFYQQHESLQASLELGLGDFSDNNQRQSINLKLSTGLYRSERHQWDSDIYINVQRNDSIDAPYFNPKQLTTLGSALNYTGTLKQRYTRFFKHHLGFDLALQQQQSFSSDLIWGLRYEHEWQRNAILQWRYGLAYHVPVYDGETETRLRLYGNLTRRF